jgi:hypothetical protein
VQLICRQHYLIKAVKFFKKIDIGVPLKAPVGNFTSEDDRIKSLATDAVGYERL